MRTKLQEIASTANWDMLQFKQAIGVLDKLAKRYSPTLAPWHVDMLRATLESRIPKVRDTTLAAVRKELELVKPTPKTNFLEK